MSCSLSSKSEIGWFQPSTIRTVSFLTFQTYWFIMCRFYNVFIAFFYFFVGSRFHSISRSICSIQFPPDHIPPLSPQTPNNFFFFTAIINSVTAFMTKKKHNVSLTDMHDSGSRMQRTARSRASTLFGFDLAVFPQNQKIWVSPRCSVSSTRAAPSGRQPINLCRRSPDGLITIAEIIGTNTRRPIRAEEMSCCYFLLDTWRDLLSFCSSGSLAAPWYLL